MCVNVKKIWHGVQLQVVIDDIAVDFWKLFYEKYIWFNITLY